MKYAWYDFAGNVGVALMLFAYLLLQVGKLQINGLRYLVMNVIGARCAHFTALQFQSVGLSRGSIWC